MQRDVVFRAWLTEDPRYLSFVHELELYAGLVRDDETLLEFLGERFARYAGKMKEVTDRLGWPSTLEGLQLPETEDKEEFINKISEQLVDGPAGEDERIAELEDLDTDDASAVQLKRPEVRKLMSKWMRGLRAYSLVYKNLEHVSDELKRRHLRIILEGWSTLITFFCVMFRTILTEREVWIGTHRYIIEMPETLRVNFLRALLVNLPDFIADDLRACLGSGKLELQLKADDIVAELGALFLQKGLVADLRLPEYHGEMGKAQAENWRRAVLLGGIVGQVTKHLSSFWQRRDR